MLPSSGSSYGSYGSYSKRGKKNNETIVNIVLVALVVGVLGLGWGYSSQRAYSHSLKQQRDKLEADIVNKNHELAVMKSQVDSKTNDYYHLDQSYQALRRQLEDAHIHINNKENELAQKDQHIMQVHEEKAGVHSKLVDTEVSLQTELGQLKARLARTDHEHQETLAELNTLRSKATDKDSEVVTLRGKVQELSSSVDDLRRQLQGERLVHKSREDEWRELSSKWGRHEQQLQDALKKLKDQLTTAHIQPGIDPASIAAVPTTLPPEAGTPVNVQLPKAADTQQQQQQQNLPQPQETLKIGAAATGAQLPSAAGVPAGVPAHVPHNNLPQAQQQQQQATATGTGTQPTDAGTPAQHTDPTIPPHHDWHDWHDEYLHHYQHYFADYPGFVPDDWVAPEAPKPAQPQNPQNPTPQQQDAQHQGHDTHGGAAGGQQQQVQQQGGVGGQQHGMGMHGGGMHQQQAAAGMGAAGVHGMQGQAMGHHPAGMVGGMAGHHDAGHAGAGHDGQHHEEHHHVKDNLAWKMGMGRGDVHY